MLNRKKEKIINEIFSEKPKKDKVILYVIESKNVKEAISRAFASKNNGEKKRLNSHQHRVGVKNLEYAYNLCSDSFEENLETCNSFEEIIQLFDSFSFKGYRFGNLAKYDIALRMAFYLHEEKGKDCLPKMVYLYGTGPLNAFKNLIGTRVKKKKVSIDELKPCEILYKLLIKNNFEPWEIEVRLCDYWRGIK